MRYIPCGPEDQRALLALPDEEISQGLKRSFPFLLRFELLVALVVYGERQEVLNGGDGVLEVFVEPQHRLGDLLLPGR